VRGQASKRASEQESDDTRERHARETHDRRDRRGISQRDTTHENSRSRDERELTRETPEM